jgi:hypothetical protein
MRMCGCGVPPLTLGGNQITLKDLGLGSSVRAGAPNGAPPRPRQTGIGCPATCSDYALASARWLTVQIANIAGTTSARRWHRAWVTVRTPVFLSLAQNLGEVNA